MNNKTKIKYIQIGAFFYINLVLFSMPLAVHAESFDTEKTIYGLSKIMSCGDFDKETAKLSLSSSALSVYKKVFNTQCLGQDAEELYYQVPGELSGSTSITGGMKCSELQKMLIQTKAMEQTVSDKFINVYKTECLSVVAPEPVSVSSQSRYAPIDLAAPIPIEGGDKIEASNKSYLFTYMVKLYRFVLGIAGVAAVIEIIIAGFMIVLAAGDSGRVEEGKKRIIQTLEGIGILFTSAVILNTINPVGFNWETSVYTENSFNEPATSIVSSIIDDVENKNLRSDGTFKNAINTAMARKISTSGYVGGYSGETFNTYGDLFKKHATADIPPELIAALATQETGLGLNRANPAHAVSNEGAAGLMQFMFDTAKGFPNFFSKNRLQDLRTGKVHFNCPQNDDRCDPERSVKAGVQYLGTLYKNRQDTGSPYAYALLSYYAGPGTINKILAEFGKSKKYTEIFNESNYNQVYSVVSKTFPRSSAKTHDSITRTAFIYAGNIQDMCEGNAVCKEKQLF